MNERREALPAWEIEISHSWLRGSSIIQGLLSDLISPMASSIFQLLLQNPFLSNHSIHALQEGCVLGAPCMSSPVSGEGWSYACQLELATLVLTAPGRCCTQEACTHQVSEMSRLAWGPEGRSRWTGKGNFGRRWVYLPGLPKTDTPPAGPRPACPPLV